MPGPAPKLKTALVLPGLLFEALVRGKNYLYSRRFLKVRRLPAPVISVGNLTLGGSGKTPLVIRVAETLVGSGQSTVLLTRGYGRKSPGRRHLVRPGSNRGPSPLEVGDEPALIRRHVPAVWLAVSSDRYGMALQVLDQLRSPVFVLDDGFQHRKLHRDLDILVLDPTQPFRENRVIPRGTLREPIEGLVRAKAIVINGSPPAAELESLENLLCKIHPAASIFHCVQEIVGLMPLENWKNPDPPDGEISRCRSAFLVAAVGNPDRLRRDVAAYGIDVRGYRLFRDHSRLAGAQWNSCAREALACGAEAILITEKDAVKIVDPPDFPILVCTQSTRVEEEEAFGKLLIGAIAGQKE